MTKDFILQDGKAKIDKGEVVLISDATIKPNVDLVATNINLQQKVSGRFTIFEIDSESARQIERNLERKAAMQEDFSEETLSELLTKYQAKEVAKIENIALQSGVGIYEDVGPSSVSRIVAGNEASPIASTFTTQQDLQSPISGLNFPRIGSWSKSDITNGFRWSFVFRRPAISLGGTAITEMGVQVVQGNNSALLNRVWSPNSGLPHTLSTTQDTLCVVEIDKVFS